MLPYPDDFPPAALQSPPVAGIALAVGCDLLLPFLRELQSPSREAPPMPEVAIDEYCDAERPKDEIGPAWQITALGLEFCFEAPQNHLNRLFGFGVPPADT